MPATATAQIDRAEINRANSQYSTGPRTGTGKQRSSLNALRHGLTACTAVLPSENQAAYEQHHRQFLDEYQPANATETQLVKELADTYFPDASKIILVQDNLNTHKPASLYEAFPAAEARRLVERFEWHYTPKHGSWLDMLSRPGL